MRIDSEGLPIIRFTGRSDKFVCFGARIRRSTWTFKGARFTSQASITVVKKRKHPAMNATGAFCDRSQSLPATANG